MKKFIYEAVDGTHWPDTFRGSDLQYSIDLSGWLGTEHDTLVNVEWTLPSGITGSNAFENDTKAYINISADTLGSHTIECKVTSEESGNVQTNTVRMVLKVY